MDIKVELGNIVEVDADTIIVNLFEGVSYPGGSNRCCRSCSGWRSYKI